MPFEQGDWPFPGGTGTLSASRERGFAMAQDHDHGHDPAHHRDAMRHVTERCGVVATTTEIIDNLLAA